MGEQPLANAGAVFLEAANGADSIARLASFDMALANAGDPDGVAVEVTDNGPDLIGRSVRKRYCKKLSSIVTLLWRETCVQVRLMDTPPSASSAVPVVKLDKSEAR